MTYDEGITARSTSSRFDELFVGTDVDADLRSFLDGVPGVTLPPASARPVAARVPATPAAPATAPVSRAAVTPAPARPVDTAPLAEAAYAPVRSAAVTTPPAVPAAPLGRSAAPAPAAMPVYAAPAPAATAPAGRAAARVPAAASVPAASVPEPTPAPAAPASPAAPRGIDVDSFLTPAPTGRRAQSFAAQAVVAPSAEAASTVSARAGEVEAVLRAQITDVDSELIASIRAVLALNASDLHLVAESTPVVRIDGELKSVAGTTKWSRERVRRVIESFVPAQDLEAFEKNLELDLAYSVGDIARFRVNIFQDQRGLGAALRIIPTEIKSVAQLGLPPELVDLAHLPRGLVLVCGPTGSGKSTTLAAIIDKANSSRASHIVTVEDPIEFLHHHKRGIINQREVGADTHSFSDALKHALRQDPDIILVGEMRDLETISTALTAAETGHLVFATLHTQDAGQTIDRIIDVYPAHQQAQVRAQLAASLRAVVVQTLIRRSGGKGRAVATEVMFSTPAIQALIRAGKTHQLRTALQAGNSIGMHTLDQDLARLVLAGEISHSQAADLAQEVVEFEQLVRNRGLGRGADSDPSHSEGSRQVAGDGGPRS